MLHSMLSSFLLEFHRYGRILWCVVTFLLHLITQCYTSYRAIDISSDILLLYGTYMFENPAALMNSTINQHIVKNLWVVACKEWFNQHLPFVLSILDSNLLELCRLVLPSCSILDLNYLNWMFSGTLLEHYFRTWFMWSDYFKYEIAVVLSILCRIRALASSAFLPVSWTLLVLLVSLSTC